MLKCLVWVMYYAVTLRRAFIQVPGLLKVVDCLEGCPEAVNPTRFTSLLEAGCCLFLSFFPRDGLEEDP